MARTRKYPLWPEPGEKEIPYDTAHFIMWCVDEEGMTQGSAEMYVHRIRKAFETVFNGKYIIFDLLSQAFRGYHRYPEICLKNLGMVSEWLGELIDLMSQLPAEEFFERKDLKCKPKTLSEWLSAFSAYHRYYEYRIDKLRAELGILPKSPCSRKEMRLPLSKEFSDYLLSECKYSQDTVWSYVSVLTAVYHICICGRTDDGNDDDILQIVAGYNDDWDEIKDDFEEVFATYYDLLESEIKIAKLKVDIVKLGGDPYDLLLSPAELSRGLNVLRKYHDFIRNRIKKKSSKRLIDSSEK